MKQSRNDRHYQFGSFDYDRHHLAGARFAHRGLESVDFSRVSAPGIDFRESYLHEIDFSEADLTGACFAWAKLHDVRFNGAILRDATFADAELSDVDFSGAMLQGTDLAQATLVRDVHMDNPQQWSKLTLSADGTLLAWFEERKQQIWLWKLFASEQGQVLAATSARVHALFFHPLTHLLVSVHDDQSHCSPP